MIQRKTLPVVLLFLILGSYMLTACSSDEPSTLDELESETPVSMAVESTPIARESTQNPENNAAEPNPVLQAPLIAESPTAVPELAPAPALPPGNPFGEEAARQLMADLSSTDQKEISEALDSIREAADTRFIAVLIELLRGRQIGIAAGDFNETIEALEELSGQQFGGDWASWLEWYGKSDLEPPPGFTGWKGLLLGRIDPGFDDFLQDDHPANLRVEEIVWGGVAIDGIPPLENAPTIEGVDADYLDDEEPVFGVVVNGDARAYPLRIIDNHEMANDVIGGVPVSLAYCTLCGAAIAYDGRGSDGQIYDFGTSGFLYRSNKLMYDRRTRTLWNQLTGEPVLGELVGKDPELQLLPVVLTSWSDWLSQHPDTLVLDRDTGYYPPEIYTPGVFYGDYFASSDTMFPVWQRSGLLPPKEFVYTLRLNGQPKAYQIEALANDKVLNDTLGGIPIVLIASRGAVAVDGRHQIKGDVFYNAGGEVRAFDRGDELFTPGEDPDTVYDQAGDLWQVTEEGLIGPDGKIAPRIAGHLAYWFGWYAFFPTTQLYSTSSSTG